MLGGPFGSDLGAFDNREFVGIGLHRDALAEFQIARSINAAAENDGVAGGYLGDGCFEGSG